MNERELTERAARAAGIELEWIPLTDGGAHVLRGTNRCWSPLLNSGDAFDLAVKLHINVEHLRTLRSMAYEEISAFPLGRGDCMRVERTDQDPRGAARRAIVGAAAAMCVTKEPK